jgi:hypothetical protein
MPYGPPGEDHMTFEIGVQRYIHARTNAACDSQNIEVVACSKYCSSRMRVVLVQVAGELHS